MQSGISCKGEACPHTDLEVIHKNLPRLPTECCIVLKLCFMNYYTTDNGKMTFFACEICDLVPFNTEYLPDVFPNPPSVFNIRSSPKNFHTVAHC